MRRTSLKFFTKAKHYKKLTKLILILQSKIEDQTSWNAQNLKTNDFNTNNNIYLGDQYPILRNDVIFHSDLVKEIRTNFIECLELKVPNINLDVHHLSNWTNQVGPTSQELTSKFDEGRKLQKFLGSSKSIWCNNVIQTPGKIPGTYLHTIGNKLNDSFLATLSLSSFNSSTPKIGPDITKIKYQDYLVQLSDEDSANTYEIVNQEKVKLGDSFLATLPLSNFNGAPPEIGPQLLKAKILDYLVLPSDLGSADPKRMRVKKKRSWMTPFQQRYHFLTLMAPLQRLG